MCPPYSTSCCWASSTQSGTWSCPASSPCSRPSYEQCLKAARQQGLVTRYHKALACLVAVAVARTWLARGLRTCSLGGSREQLPGRHMISAPGHCSVLQPGLPHLQSSPSFFSLHLQCTRTRGFRGQLCTLIDTCTELICSGHVM